MATEYAGQEYWDERYRKSLEAGPAEERGPLFDWLCTCEDLIGYLPVGCLLEGCCILDLGCGNSILAEHIAESHHLGQRTPACVEAVDFSSIAMEAMAARARPNLSKWLLQYQVMDARMLTFRAGIFDVLIDKGCLDALLNEYDQEQWWRHCGSKGDCRYDGKASAKRGNQLMAEVSRVLAPSNGVLILVSLEPPKGRMLFIDRPEYGWNVSVKEDEHGNYVYTATRVDKTQQFIEEHAENTPKGTLDLKGETVHAAHADFDFDELD
ncbi:hypothetical protein CYMTET_5901 [Cymbomonas tetramitiformis]|uniref:Methyltransferase domain-containing protein n=1 Tax=Cymbomonas tetramitiformis TaxID=36881 RepID=A0AAE0GYM3_9CHLO|nr:hypothetical protein CYMTET_5901 [Cymbomonas tetramitiformis]